MTRAARLPITPSVGIAWSEIEFRATRSGGPGGQHANTSSTRVELRWNPLTSTSLSPDEVSRLKTRLSHRLSDDGWLRVVASTTRSQHQNRELAIARLQELVARALAVPKARRATQPTRAARERRLQAKRQRAAIKRERRQRPDEG